MSVLCLCKCSWVTMGKYTGTDVNTASPTVVDTDKQTQLVRARARTHTFNSLEPSIASTALHAHAPRA